MGLHADAIAAVRSVLLVDERVQSTMTKVDELAGEVVAIKERLIRLETIIEITRGDGTTLRIAPRPDERAE